MDLEAEYNNRALVPDYEAIFARWAKTSAAFRGAVAAADLGVPYGASERQTLDIIWPSENRRAPLILFIHGGYWRSLHPRDFTFVAAPYLARGIAMAFAGYDLCPGVSIGAILGQARAAAITLHRLVGRRFAVCGHSAGGHLAACLTATSWREFDVDTPDDMIPAGMGISGLYELAPLLSLAVNDDLKLSAEEAKRLSPVGWPVPKGRTFETFVGDQETSEFKRHSRDLAAAWSTQGVRSTCREVEGANHYTVVDALADPASPMLHCLVELARAAAR